MAKNKLEGFTNGKLHFEEGNAIIFLEDSKGRKGKFIINTHDSFVGFSYSRIDEDEFRRRMDYLSEEVERKIIEVAGRYK